MKRKDFIEKLSYLLRVFEVKEEIELSFAFFDDPLDEKYVWEENGFKKQKDLKILESERNLEGEKRIASLKLEEFEKISQIEPNENFSKL